MGARAGTKKVGRNCACTSICDEGKPAAAEGTDGVPGLAPIGMAGEPVGAALP